MTDPELLARIEKLERDNRRLKGLGVAAFVLVGALGLIAAARPVPNVIKAHEFDAVDAAGTPRVAINADSFGPRVTFYGKKDLPTLEIADFGPDGPAIMVGFQTKKGFVVPDIKIASSPSGEPSIGLHDAKGFEMMLGSTKTHDITTGATQQSSADSILMFGNDKKHHVIWQAP